MRKRGSLVMQMDLLGVERGKESKMNKASSFPYCDVWRYRYSDDKCMFLFLLWIL